MDDFDDYQCEDFFDDTLVNDPDWEAYQERRRVADYPPYTDGE